jgi:allantoin racemase
MGCASALREGLQAHGIDVPVIDPIPAAVSVAAALVRSNLAHSKLTFPQPPEKQLLGYDYIHLPMPLAAE